MIPRNVGEFNLTLNDLHLLGSFLRLPQWQISALNASLQNPG